MQPQTSFVMNQAIAPTAGDVDDCWCLAAIMAVLAVAPWLAVPTVKRFRAAAGNPDDPAQPDGGTIAQVARGIRTLFPEIGALIAATAGTLGWVPFKSLIQSGHVACLFLRSSRLPVELQFGFGGLHASALAWNEGWLFGNPLAPAQSRWRRIEDGAIEAAAKSWPGEGVFAVVMPTVEEAFKTHPLYPGSLDAAVALATKAINAELGELRGNIGAARLRIGEATEALAQAAHVIEAA